jgi:fluoride exporter
MALIKNYSFISENMRLAIVTGFLGSLTTFSTFSAETVTMLFNEQYLWGSLIIVSHVLGSLVATIAGFYFFKVFI